MKRCPQCGREYDNSMMFCLDDGAELLYGPGAPDSPEASTAVLRSDEHPTAVLHGGSASSSAETRAQINRDHASAGKSEGRQRFSSRLLVSLAVAAVAALVVLGGYYRYFNGSNSGQIRSIAVLPIQNHSGSTDADYLSDGITDSLIFRLSQLPDLKVSPTSSVMRYKGADTGLDRIARELDVDAVMSGRLVQIGDSLNISIQLIDAVTNKVIWAENYDRKMTDLLATQREIATSITQKLELKLSGDEKGIAKKYTSSNEAYQLYLKGRYHWAKRTADDLNKAIDAYKRAIAIDPGFALAYVGTAEVYNSMGKDPDLPPNECIPLAKAAAARALEIDQGLAQAHSALGDSLALGDWDWAGSEREFKRAIELDPNISYTYVAYAGSFLTPARRTDEALAATQKATELEPLSLINHALHVASLMNMRRDGEALEQARKAYELDRDFPLTIHWLGLALVANGKYDEAISMAGQVPPQSPARLTSLYVQAYAHAKAGRNAEAQEAIAAMREIGKLRYVRTYYLACVYAALGDKDKAFAELERSFVDKDCYLPRASVDPAMDPLRGDPRFGEILKRLRLPQ